MIKKVSWILLIMPLALTFSCDSNRIYEENFSVADNVWNVEDVKTFTFNMEDTLSALDLYINLRTTGDYPYSNIYLFLYSQYPNGYSDKDTLEFILAEPDGKWLGEYSGSIVENQILIARGGRFQYPGDYTFKIQHAMTEDNLPEIVDVGFRVAYTESE